MNCAHDNLIQASMPPLQPILFPSVCCVFLTPISLSLSLILSLTFFLSLYLSFYPSIYFHPMSISRTWRSRCRGRWSRSCVWTWRCVRSGSTGSSSRATSRRSPKEKIRLIWFTGCVHQLMLDILFLPSPWNYRWNWQLSCDDFILRVSMTGDRYFAAGEPFKGPLFS